jgi:hypothetical protein
MLLLRLKCCWIVELLRSVLIRKVAWDLLNTRQSVATTLFWALEYTLFSDLDWKWQDMKERKYMKESNINSETKSLHNFINTFHCWFKMYNFWIALDWIGLDWIGLDWIGLDAGAVVTCFILMNQTEIHH